MRSIHPGPSLAAAITLGLALLIAAMFGLGVAIRQGVVAPPNLDVQLSGLRITAYTTPECQPYSHCSNSTRNYYVVWCNNELVSGGQPYRRFRKRLPIVPLKR